MYRCLGFVLACTVVMASTFAADEGIPEKTLNDLKAATVYVKVEGKNGDLATGSGFLVRVEGETGFVVTNNHVVAAVQGEFTPEKYSLVFWSGTKKEQILPAQVVAADADGDLAVLKVTSKTLPAPLDLGQKVQLRETMTIYTFGFPLGDLLSRSKGNPALTVGKGTVSSFREDEHGKLYRIQLDGELNPGNSGGPVVDAEGKLVGIAVSKIVGTKISFAIPPADLNDLLKGRVAAVTIKSMRINNGEAQLEIEVPCVDPLHKIKSVELLHVRKDALQGAPLAAKDGVWPELPSSEKVALRIDGDKCKGTLTLKCSEKKAIDYVFQTAYATGADGKSMTTEPLTQAVNFAANGVVRVDDPRLKWETITSKEGGFTVDMPVKPQFEKSQTRKRPGSTTKIFMLGCETKTGFYMACRIDLPTAVIRGAEDAELDSQRDLLAEDWHGKVIGEKKVRASGNPGRDFTVRGKPEDSTGVLTIRVRQYLVGKTVYCVFVVSPPNKELPVDSGRFLGSLAIGEAKTRAAGTPEPEQTGTEIKDWGLAIDPDKDCKIAPLDQSLAMVLPGTLHDLFFDGGPTNAPRVMREVEGDFVVTVKVVGEFMPGPKSTNPKTVPYHGGGILLWSDSDNNIRFERYAFLKGGRNITGVAFQEREGGYGGANHNEPFKAGDMYLRLERKGSRINGAVSSDGKTWKALKPIDTVWPDKLKVGLTAITTSSEPFSVKFDEFELKTKGSGADKK